MIRRFAPLVVASLAVSLPAQTTSIHDRPIAGFSMTAAASEQALEAQYDSRLNRNDLRDWMKRLTARPHHLGSAYDRDNAEFIASLFRSWGYETAIEEFQVLFPTPKNRLLEMVGPEHFAATLAETPLKDDPTSSQVSEQLPTFNAYSIDGDVTGDLVYVNFGVPKDYEELEHRGIDVRGKVVIARYGGSWRGIKPKVAAEHGAIGCLIYSDPRDDGYFQGDVYPKGAFRNDSGAQRGSVMDMPQYPGDPLTPGVGATPTAKRLDRKDVTTLTKIPVLPISYGDALPLLRAISGSVAPAEWRGSLPITYHIGPGPARVHLKVEFNWNMVPARDVIARLRGSLRPDEWILRGNHYDAWVNGASDPISGQVAMLEEAKAIGQLAKAGHRPERTIIYAAWDGEEEGLLGSTEWAETHAEELQKNAVVYINSDSTGRGFLDVEGSHTLESFVNGVAQDVNDPERNVPVLQRLRARQLTTAAPGDRKSLRGQDGIRIDALGSGSDYSAFLQHLGIAALNVGYGGEGGSGSYHSIFDSYAHFIRFVDPDFRYGLIQAQTTGRMVLRLANAEVLPFEFTHMADTVARYVDDVAHLATSMREEAEERNLEINDQSLLLAADPMQQIAAPKLETVAPYLNFAPLQNAVAGLERSAKSYDVARGSAISSPSTSMTGESLDRILMHAERMLTRDQGLPRRPWYRHFVYAPGYYTGYGVKTLPGVREAIEQRQYAEAEQQVTILAGILDGYAAEIDRATAIAQGRKE